MFQTWRIWGALRFPQKTHAIFRMAVRAHQRPQPRFGNWWRIALLGVIIGVPTVIICAINPFFIVPFLLSVAFLIPFLLLISGTVLGAIWLYQITNQLISFQQTGRFEPLSTTPVGTWGTSWLIAMGTIHSTSSFKRLSQIYSLSIRTLAIASVCITAIFWIVSFNIDSDFSRPSNQIVFALNIIPVLVIAFAIVLDQIQSITIGVLAGILAGSVATLGRFVGVLAVLIFITLQVATYIFSLLAYFIIMTILREMMTDTLVSAGAMIVTLALFFLLREAFIGILLRLIKVRFDLTVQDINQVIVQQSD